MTYQQNEKLGELENLQAELKAIKKELIYNYNYSYFDTNIAGSKEGAIVPNENLNEKFGPSRKGYELFRNEFDELRVGYGGVVSLREITLRDSDELVGYVVEEKQPTRPYIQQADDIYDDVLFGFKELLEVKDEESLDFYINENGPGYDLHEKDNVSLQARKVAFLMDIIHEYNEDESFMRFFDKIIK